MKSLVIAILLLCTGCSVNTHLKLSRYHFQKAKSKGYTVLGDSIRKINSIKPINLTNREINYNVAVTAKIDTLLIEYCEERNDATGVIKEAIKYASLDTVINFKDGVTIHVVLKDGLLSADMVTSCPENEPIYINQKEPKFWKMWEWWVLLGLLLLVIYISRR